MHAPIIKPLNTKVGVVLAESGSDVFESLFCNLNLCGQTEKNIMLGRIPYEQKSCCTILHRHILDVGGDMCNC